jgi:integrase
LNVGRAQQGLVTHSLRHFFKTHCINSRVPSQYTDAWLGHQGDRSAGGRYFHLMDELSQRMMKDMSFGTDCFGAVFPQTR